MTISNSEYPTVGMSLSNSEYSTSITEDSQEAPKAPRQSGLAHLIKSESRTFTSPSLSRKSSQYKVTEKKLKWRTTVKSNMDKTTIDIIGAVARNKSANEIGSFSSDKFITRENIVDKLKELFGFTTNKKEYVPGDAADEIIVFVSRLDLSKEEDKKAYEIVLDGLDELATELKTGMKQDSKKLERFYAEMLKITNKAIEGDSIEGNIPLDVICMHGKKDLKALSLRIFLAFKKKPEEFNKITKFAAEHEVKCFHDAKRPPEELFREESLFNSLSRTRINHDSETTKFLDNLKKMVLKLIGKKGSEVSVDPKALARKFNDKPESFITDKIEKNRKAFTDLCTSVINHITSQTLSKEFREILKITREVVAEYEEYKDRTDTAVCNFPFLRVIGPYLSVTIGADINKQLTPLKRSLFRNIANVFQKCALLLSTKEIDKKTLNPTIFDEIFLEIGPALKNKCIEFIQSNSTSNTVKK
jgi:hypothetical protein